MKQAEIDEEILELKWKLHKTDYEAIKHSEGLIPEEEYEPIKTQRQEWRDRINELQEMDADIEEVEVEEYPDIEEDSSEITEEE